MAQRTKGFIYLRLLRGLVFFSVFGSSLASARPPPAANTVNTGWLPYTKGSFQLEPRPATHLHAPARAPRARLRLGGVGRGSRGYCVGSGLSVLAIRFASSAPSAPSAARFSGLISLVFLCFFRFFLWLFWREFRFSSCISDLTYAMAYEWCGASKHKKALRFLGHPRASLSMRE